MAKRRRLEAPGAAELADLEAGFAAKPVLDRMGLTAPIAQIAAETARAAQPLDTEQRVSFARDSVDAAAWRSAQQEGRVITDLPLEAIDAEHLVRDRMIVEADELEELKSSVRAHGLRLPIEVIALEGGRYGLVSGWRRLTVLRQLAAEGSRAGGPSPEGPAYATIKAIIRAPYEAGAIYTAMVEENELRAQVTPYERGRIAVLAAQVGAFPDTETAIETIFAAASRAKRSKIRSFALVHEELGDMLRHPADLSERNGLRLAHALREGFADPLRHALIRSEGWGDGRGPAQEWALLEPVLAEAEALERKLTRGGRPKTQAKPPAVPPRFAPPPPPDHPPASTATLASTGPLASTVTLEREMQEDGCTIRLRGPGITPELADRLADRLLDHLRQIGAAAP